MLDTGAGREYKGGGCCPLTFIDDDDEPEDDLEASCVAKGVYNQRKELSMEESSGDARLASSAGVKVGSSCRQR